MVNQFRVHAKHCVLVPSGLAAVAVVGMAFCASGGEVLLPSNVYGPSVALAANEFKAWGISHRFYNPMQPQSLADLIGPNTQLVWLETPGSVTMEFVPLDELLAVCKAKGVVTALDNTWGAGLAFNGFDVLGDGSLGADVVVQALKHYFHDQAEDKAVLQAANLSFAEWDNPKDADYDKL